MSADVAGDGLPYDYWRDPDAGADEDSHCNETVDDDDLAGAAGGAESEHVPLVHQFNQRVTVDFDGKHQASLEAFRLEAVRIWHSLERIADRVDVHVSSGQHGLHFVAWFRDSVPFDEQVQIRRQHGDDVRRIDMDSQRWKQLGGRFSDVLFQTKGGRKTVKERRFRDVYDALDFIVGQRKDSTRMNRLANEGHKGAPDLARRARADR